MLLRAATRRARAGARDENAIENEINSLSCRPSSSPLLHGYSPNLQNLSPERGDAFWAWFLPGGRLSIPTPAREILPSGHHHKPAPTHVVHASHFHHPSPSPPSSPSSPSSSSSSSTPSSQPPPDSHPHTSAPSSPRFLSRPLSFLPLAPAEPDHHFESHRPPHTPRMEP